MNIKMLKASLAGLVLSVSGFANAGLITVESYDITNTNLSTHGSWQHTYDGNMTLDGTSYDYTNGSGTLNDGIIGTTDDNTHLFNSSLNSVITLFFSETVTLSNFNLYSFANGGNSIPGNISDINIHYNNTLYSLASTGFGGPSGGNANAHEAFDVSGSVLDGLALDQLTFSINTNTLTSYSSYYSISEVEVFGEASGQGNVSVPEPSTLAIFALGIIGLASRRFKKK
jgi:hypothetical protein